MVRVFAVPELVARELYPGHHSERAVSSEGIVSLALEVALDDPDADAALVYADLGIDYDLDRATAVRAFRHELDGLQSNADGVSREQAVDDVMRWGLVERARAEKSIEFVSHPTWRAYITSYSAGYELCRRWVGGDVRRFRRLLNEQVTPAELAFSAA